jgi:hypothetical protein
MSQKPTTLGVPAREDQEFVIQLLKSIVSANNYNRRFFIAFCFVVI